MTLSFLTHSQPPMSHHPRLVVGLLLAACATPGHAPVDAVQGLLRPGSSVVYRAPEASRQEVQLLGEDLVLRAGQGSVVVSQAAQDGSLRFQREGRIWTFDLDGARAVWDGATLRVGEVVHQLQLTEPLRLDRSGARLP